MRKHNMLLMKRILFAVLMAWSVATVLHAQVRVTPNPLPPRPKGNPGYKPIAEPWANVQPTFHHAYQFPEWQIPSDLDRWKKHRRKETLQTVVGLLGDLPSRPSPPIAKITRTEDRGDHVAEYLEIDNGSDMIITGLLLRPKGLMTPAPTIVVMHGWSGNKDNVLSRVGPVFDELVGPMLVKQGYVVAAIDTCFRGDRHDNGPNDIRDLKTQPGYTTERNAVRALVGINTLFGRSMMGMMVREQQCLIDYLATRPEVDAKRIGATGMSFGNTTGYWLTATDPRVKVFVGIVCFTRHEELIKQGNAYCHNNCHYVQGMLQNFDTEGLFSLIAPRPVLQLNGDSDPSCPVTGIEVLEKKLADVYRMFEKPQHFQSVVYKDTGHIYIPDMKQRMLAWFLKHLPPKRKSA